MDVFYFGRCGNETVLFVECGDSEDEVRDAANDAEVLYGCKVRVRRLSASVSSLWIFSVSRGDG
jgi:hypothetical protein